MTPVYAYVQQKAQKNDFQTKSIHNIKYPEGQGWWLSIIKCQADKLEKKVERNKQLKAKAFRKGGNFVDPRWPQCEAFRASLQQRSSQAA